MHGLDSESDIEEDYCEDNDLSSDELTDEDREAIWDAYVDNMEGWLSYLVTTVEEDPNHDRFYRW